MMGRFDTTGNPEDEYYPGTSVLVNLQLYLDFMFEAYDLGTT